MLPIFLKELTASAVQSLFLATKKPFFEVPARMSAIARGEASGLPRQPRNTLPLSGVFAGQPVQIVRLLLRRNVALDLLALAPEKNVVIHGSASTKRLSLGSSSGSLRLGMPLIAPVRLSASTHAARTGAHFEFV